MAAADFGWLQRLATRNNELLNPVFFSDQCQNPISGTGIHGDFLVTTDTLIHQPKKFYLYADFFWLNS